MLNTLIRRNRYKSKNRSKAEKPAWQWPPGFAHVVVTEWRSYARRAALIGLVAGALAALAWALDRPVRVISMDGSFQRVSPGQIEKAVAPFAHSGFMSADLDAIERAVEALPWVDHARVQRRWPNSLHVTVVEQIAAARWGESGLLNTRGELFVRAGGARAGGASAPVGPRGHRVAGRASATSRPKGACRRPACASRRCASTSAAPGRWTWISGVTVRLGRLQVDERIDRFIRTASQVIAHRLNDITYVDMRYSNGFAIGWRNVQTPATLPAKHTDDTDA